MSNRTNPNVLRQFTADRSKELIIRQVLTAEGDKALEIEIFESHHSVGLYTFEFNSDEVKRIITYLTGK